MQDILSELWSLSSCLSSWRLLSKHISLNLLSRFFFQEKDSLGSLNLLDGSHSYVAAHTIHYKNKIKGDMARAETEAMCAFLNQFMPIDYNKVSTACFQNST